MQSYTNDRGNNMNKNLSAGRALACGAALIACATWAAPTLAASLTWDMRNNDGCGASGEPACSSSYGNTRGYTQGGIKLTTSGYADTNGNNWSEDSRSIETAYLGHYGGDGLGVTNRDETGSSPNHSTDNDSRFDAVRLEFDTAVRLTDLYFGWAPGDSDFTVLYHTGPGSTALTGERYDTLSPEWAVLGHYDSNGTGTKSLTNAGIYSRYWLVLAYNNVYTGTTLNLDGGATSADERDDYFKIGKVTAHTPTQVPESGSLALLGLGLVGLACGRRRR